MKNVKIGKKKLGVALYLLVVKLLYMASIAFLLPEKYEIWDYGKNIAWEYILIELPILFAAFLLGFRNYRGDRSLSVVSLLVATFAFIPANSGLSMSGQDPLYYLCVNLYFCILLAVLNHLSSRRRLAPSTGGIEVRSFFTGRKFMVLRLFSVCVCLATIVYVYQLNGLNLSIVSSEMYDTRANYASYIAENSGTLLSYFLLVLTGLTTWFLPLYLYVAIVRKKLLDVALALVTYAALYLMEMQKSTLLIVLVIFAIVYCERKNARRSICDYIMLFFVAMFTIILVEYALFGRKSWLFTMFVPRMFYMPTYLNGIYYDYFSQHSKMWFTRDVLLVSNILSKLIGALGSDSAVTAISKSFFKGYIPSPNTGFFAEAYAQLGYLGVVVFPFILGAIVSLIRKTASWYGKGIEVALSVRLVLLMLDTQMLAPARMVGILLFVAITYLLKLIDHTLKRRKPLGN